MSALNIVSIEKFEILPSNQPANNTYSFKQGNPIITWNIGSTNKMLRASSLRINGKIRIKASNGDMAGNNSINKSRGNGGAATTGAITCNSRLGVNGVFQNVNISSNDTNQTLESVRQYGRMLATVLPSTHSPEDFLNNRGVVELNTGMNAVSANLNNNTTSFSSSLKVGMFNGGNSIPMGINGVRGLTISIELVSDQQFLTGASASAGAFYELCDLSITGDYMVPDSKGMAELSVAGSGAFQYNSFNNMYSVIDASDSTQTYNLASSNVLDIFHNFLPVSHANNYSEDSYSTGLPKNTNAGGSTYTSDVLVNKVGFSRGGMKLALDYDLDVTAQSANSRPQTGVLVNALNSVLPFSQMRKLTNQPQLEGFGGNDQEIYNSSGLQLVSSVDAGVKNFAIGIAVDNVSKVGIDFRGQAYASRIQSNLDGKSPNSVYTYILNKNTLMYSPQGISIVS